MSRVPLLYFSRGQLEPPDWPDAVVDVAARISKGEVKSAAVTIRHWKRDALTIFMRLETLSWHTGGAIAYKTLGQYGEIGCVRRFWVPCCFFASPLGQGERRSANLQATNCTLGPARSFVFKRKDYLPIVLHADDSPAVLLRLIVKGLRERADLRIGQARGRAVGVFAFRVVVKHQHAKSRTAAGFGVFEHLLIAGRVAKRRIGTAADHQVNALGFAGVIVIQKHLRLLGQERLAILVITIRRAAHGADDLLEWDAIGLLGKLTHEILPTAGDNVGLESIGAKILQHLLHGLVGQLGVRLLPARVLGF